MQINSFKDNLHIIKEGEWSQITCTASPTLGASINKQEEKL